jgi:hypothetical protein
MHAYRHTQLDACAEPVGTRNDDISKVEAATQAVLYLDMVTPTRDVLLDAPSTVTGPTEQRGRVTRGEQGWGQVMSGVTSEQQNCRMSLLRIRGGNLRLMPYQNHYFLVTVKPAPQGQSRNMCIME